MSRDSSDPFVITGVGVVSPLGTGREITWNRLLNNETAIHRTSRGFEARVTDFSPNGARSRMGDFALLAAEEALRQAKLFDVNERDGIRIGCSVGQSKPIFDADPSLLMAGFFGWSADTLIPKYFSLEGPSSNVIAACATGLASLKVAEQWLEEEVCDAVLVGAAESSLNDFYQAGFEKLGVLAHGADASAICPFSGNRNGFAMGEGSAVMTVEKLSSAEKRGVQPIAIVRKVVLQQSRVDSLRFDEDGETVARLIRYVCEDETVDYVNAHGTGTLVNDRAETLGLKKVFGGKVYSVPVSSTKAATGHLLGAAGALEAAFAVLALRDGKIPATLHLNQSDPECDLDYVPHRSRSANLKTALTLSYGFGGQMGAAVFHKYD